MRNFLFQFKTGVHPMTALLVIILFILSFAALNFLEKGSVD